MNGLWTVIQPCARPTNLATLNRKRLAVDASIWIYQFLKAVRDKEGNALRNSHVVGFFRRICKLLWFGILPVFVFDGGAPALKRATIQGRKKRREGRREDAARTASKLLAVQMKRIADEEEEKRKRETAKPRDRDNDFDAREAAAQYEELPEEFVYASQVNMTPQERQQSRKFHKQDAYHLPDLHGGITNMGNPEDPRIMSLEELEEYARQFHSGEDINLYDFSKIDFDGDFFKTLPPADRYNILNAARLRSRLRMGLSKDQLDDMFPDRMAFSKFQIERVKERNNLTQRLMAEAGMTGLDLTLKGSSRIAGDKDREYILVKNDGADGGWALGVVSKEKDIGEAHKPIDVDAIQIEYQSKEAEEDEDEDEEFEDIPIEGLNRLPQGHARSQANAVYRSPEDGYQNLSSIADALPENTENAEGSLFVGGDAENARRAAQRDPEESMHPEEDNDLKRAIAMSLKNQHDFDGEEEEEQQVFEDVPMPEPEWAQKAVDQAAPIRASGGGAMIAHIVNNRANAAVSKRQAVSKVSGPPQKAEQKQQELDDSESEDDMQAILAKSRKMKTKQPAPVFENKKNPFDGPLPFPKLDWGSSLFSKSKEKDHAEQNEKPEPEPRLNEDNDEAYENAGGFEQEPSKKDSLPLPPWLTDEADIRDNLKKQEEAQRDMNAEDKVEAEEEERRYRKEMQDRTIEIDSSDDGSDVEIISKPPSPKLPSSKPESPVGGGFMVEGDSEHNEKVTQDVPGTNVETPIEPMEKEESVEPEFEDVQAPVNVEQMVKDGDDQMDEDKEPSPELEFENVLSQQPVSLQLTVTSADVSTSNAVPDSAAQITAQEEDDLFADVEYDEFSDPEDEELMAQLAEEAEEHARFASELNNKSARQNKEDYEKELRQLRNQQKKDRRDADEVTQVMITECQALLRLFGIPYITAPMEAEAQCAELVSLGLVDGIVTDDSDTFLFGGTRVYKNMFNSNKFVECYLGVDIEKELSLSREQLISLAQLLGSDYTEGLPGVGPVTAVEILSEFPGKAGLEDFKEWWKDVQSQTRAKAADASSSFRKKFRKAQAAKLFLPPGFPNPAVYEAYLQPEVDSDSESFQWGVPDVEGLRQFLMATIGWSKERTDEVLVPVIKDMNKRDVEGTQSNITRFFSGGVGVGAKEAFAPRQREQGSKRMAAAVDRLRGNVSAGASGSAESAGNSGSKRRKTGRRRGVVTEEEDGEAGQ